MDEGDYRRNAEHRKRVRAAWIAAARQYLDGQLSVFEVADRLHLVRVYEPQWWDIVTPFIALWSDSDGLPIAPKVRALWSPEALKHEDERIALLAQSYADDIRAAAEDLIHALQIDETS